MAEGREPLTPEDQVDQMLNEVLGREYPPLMTFWQKSEQNMPAGPEGHGIFLYAFGHGVGGELVTAEVGDTYTSWHWAPQRRVIPIYVTTDSFPPGGIEESYSTLHDQQHKEREDVEKLKAENSLLHKKVLLLQAELRKNIPYLQLYRFGAGAFSLSVLSVLIWLFTGIAIPFHQAFALAAIPTSIGFMLMAYLTKKYKIYDTEMGNDRAST
jgi:hypothetical protein